MRFLVAPGVTREATKDDEGYLKKARELIDAACEAEEQIDIDELDQVNHED